jgi:ribosome maturation factor RimP
MNVKDKLENIAQPICKANNFILVEIRSHGDFRHPHFQIFINSEKGVTLGDCERISRLIQDQMDIEDDFYSNYRLEISSPGLDRPLHQDFEFRKNIGQQLNVKYRSEEGQKALTGKLLSFDDEKLQLDTGQGEVTINRADIEQAKVKIKW